MGRRIVVLGVTGRIGRLVAAELAGRADVLVVGRAPTQTAALGARHRLAHRVSPLDGLAGVLVPGDVLLNCTGPHDLLGAGIARTAITAAATYLDVGNEPAFLRRLLDGPEADARRARTTLVPSVGHAAVSGLWLAEEVLAAVDGQAERVQVAYLTRGGMQVGSDAGRRSLLRTLMQPTTTYRSGAHQTEPVAARLDRVRSSGQSRATVSLGGAEVWWLPRRHPALRSVDVQTAWFGPLGPAVGGMTRLVGPARRLAVDRVLDRVVGVLGEGTDAGLDGGASRVLAQVVDRRGRVVARREAVAGNHLRHAARVAAAAADAVAGLGPGDLPPGAVDLVGAVGLPRVRAILEWAGMVDVSA